MMNYCENCGKNNPETAVFCSACGANLEEEKKKTEEKKKANLQKKVPVTAFLLSCCGCLCFLALPVQLLSLGLGIYGLKLNHHKSSFSWAAILLSLLGTLLFTAAAIGIALHWDTILEWEIFSLIGRYLG